MTNDKLADEIERYLAPDAIYHHWEPSMEDMEQIIASLRAQRPQSREMVMVPRSFAHTLACRLETEAIIGDERSLARKLRDALAAAEAERIKEK